MKGRGSMSNGVEPNQSNTIDGCRDGNKGQYLTDESIESIVVKTVDGSDFMGGVEVIIDAKVYAWNTGKADFAHFFYATDIDNPTWILIGEKQPAVGGINTLSMSYLLPKGSPLQAVRVTYQYSSTGGQLAACPAGDYNDIDDVVFAVWTDGRPTKLVSNEILRDYYLMKHLLT